jgi:hypothetical protein
VTARLLLVVGALPALIVILFASLIALIALFMGDRRQRYAVDIMERATELAAVLVGARVANRVRRRA